MWMGVQVLSFSETHLSPLRARSRKEKGGEAFSVLSRLSPLLTLRRILSAIHDAARFRSSVSVIGMLSVQNAVCDGAAMVKITGKFLLLLLLLLPIATVPWHPTYGLWSGQLRFDPSPSGLGRPVLVTPPWGNLHLQ